MGFQIAEPKTKRPVTNKRMTISVEDSIAGYGASSSVPAGVQVTCGHCGIHWPNMIKIKLGSTPAFRLCEYCYPAFRVMVRQHV